MWVLSLDLPGGKMALVSSIGTPSDEDMVCGLLICRESEPWNNNVNGRIHSDSNARYKLGVIRAAFVYIFLL